ncbi:translation factor GUF1 chloroplastic [Tripterygium wilfordii]|uniref:Translation factor GUF1 chloroplastic n=1 Tax=Tripterygium wilfordii TaxID=458696 RepID=A0A7J7C0J3_TRIWF|nr:translation factor GUF1 chloroplastic [Tripterygium wilfordii]
MRIPPPHNTTDMPLRVSIFDRILPPHNTTDIAFEGFDIRQEDYVADEIGVLSLNRTEVEE